MRSIELAGALADGAGPTVYGVYGLIGVVTVALIGAAVTLLTSPRRTGSSSSRTVVRVAKHRDALVNWVLLNTEADPRKIKTGYESPAEVARDPG